MERPCVTVDVRLAAAAPRLVEKGASSWTERLMVSHSEPLGGVDMGLWYAGTVTGMGLLNGCRRRTEAPMRCWMFPLLLSLVACGSPAKKLCKQAEACEDYEYDQCLSDFEDVDALAEATDCEDVFDDFLTCFSKEAECVDGRIEPVGCIAETEAYLECFFGGYDSTWSDTLYTTTDTGL